MDLTVITVTWNSARSIEKQLESVRLAAKGLNFEQIVVDNDSSDETVEIASQFASVKLIKNQSNQGFAAANNQAVDLASGEYILFLNPDMELLEQGSLKAMLGYLKVNQEIGVLTCRLVDAKGEVNRFAGPRRLPKIREQIALILKLPHLWRGILKRYYYQDLDLDKIQVVDTARGAFMLVKREIINKLGQAFDIRFHLWFEDVDFCRRVRGMGYKIVYHPGFSCIDLVGRSFKQVDHLNRQKQFMASLLLYFKKWEPWYKWIWLALFRPIGIFMTWLYIKLK